MNRPGQYMISPPNDLKLVWRLMYFIFQETVSVEGFSVKAEDVLMDMELSIGHHKTRNPVKSLSLSPAKSPCWSESESLATRDHWAE